MNTLDIAKTLIARPSVTPNDAGCQVYIADFLEKLGFTIEHHTGGLTGEVQNLWAIRGKERPIFVFAGHTDVVPPGPLANWRTDPFVPTIQEGYLYGRGAADMKGSLAAMLMACKRFIAQYPNHSGSIAFIITSDEEGPATEGTKKVMQYLNDAGITLDYCLVGEPSSHHKLGDILKIGRRGSLNCTLKIFGKQGHVAYPHKADNPIHRALVALKALIEFSWDKGNVSFPPTSFQISNIQAGTGATNVIPDHLVCDFNLRFSTEITPEKIQKEVHALLDTHHCQYECNWKLSGLPFLTSSGKLLDATVNTLQEITGVSPKLSTEGGTSDGRFIAPFGTEVIELGPCNETIHCVNECVNIEDLETLSKIYEKILIKMLII